MPVVGIAMVIGAYLGGSIPFGLLIAKLGWGVDPRTVGSRNTGFTNVYRVVGTTPAVLTLIADAGKGLLAVLTASALITPGEGPWPLATGIAAILGHNYSCFLKGRGGKGIATGFGVLFGLNLTVGLGTLVAWMVTVLLTRRVSVGSMIAFGLLPVWAAVIPLAAPRWSSFIGTVIIAGLVILRHRENLTRLRQGLEEPLE